MLAFLDCFVLHLCTNYNIVAFFDLKVEVSVREPKGDDPKLIKALLYADRDLDRKWNKVAVRLQEGERVIRIYINDMVNPATVAMLSGIDAFPKNAQLRLAQELSKGGENQPTIIDKFKVKCPKRRNFFRQKDGSELTTPENTITYHNAL